ncbi:hypothetical protein NIE88_12625 [Sporolactobacillus shoreicorticis]|uniref:Phage protein n=1 Tax=Sporolactobacillus shoreicorticis TaxID=1923877 RepID=A0ABW5S6P0_9BACL|nr:hypothetical protein [Sporolactobacillus shoreicorticis]MCO7126609.1 hypothetical protein [Sporolactobacillus shoreicorticis]
MTYTYEQLNNAQIRLAHESNKLLATDNVTDVYARDYLIKMITLDVKLHGTKESRKLRKQSSPKSRFDDTQSTLSIMSTLSPNEIMRLFPIAKHYDGDKWGEIDYFSTIKHVKEYPLNKPVGYEQISEFLMGYDNPDIRRLMVDMMMATSDMMKQETGESLAEKMGIPTVTMQEGTNGQKYMIDENGRSKPVIEKKKRPKYLRVVK